MDGEMPVLERVLDRRERLLPDRVHLREPRWHERLGGAWALSVEWEPRDLWIGVFIKHERQPYLRPTVHVYVCPVPTVVLHFVWAGDRRGSRS